MPENPRRDRQNRTELTPMILVCGERFSANVGDGAIAECLLHLLRQLAPGLLVSAVDMSGRLRYESFGRKRRRRLSVRLLRLVRRLRPLRRAASVLEWYLSGRRRLAERLEPLLPHAALMVIGGGQLLLDTELRFPLRIAAATGMASRAGIPTAFLGCGAAASFSPVGWRLLRRALAAPLTCHVSLRDRESLENVRRGFGDAIRVPLRLGADPAIFAAEVYGFRQRSDAQAIGLGIMAPRLLRRRAGESAPFTDETVLRFWVGLAGRLRDAGHRIELFCNGAPADRAFLARVAGQLGLPVPAPPRTATELAWRIAGFRAIVAHRLHANILALSLGVPAVGLIWDDKLRQFGRLAGRERFFVEPAEQTPETVAARLTEALATPPDEAALAELRRQVREDIAAMLEAAGLAPPG
ncbi:MAG: polysaccharide pyruvyl transferase family protein [Alphaproteobacteria bacterium]|nr:polysaccharide pyruvyl transferase family protein [Alphaproteobacteria bacterium]